MSRIHHFLRKLLPSKTTIANNALCTSNKNKVLVVGLGNYTCPKSRHSVGQILLDAMARKSTLQWPYYKSCKGHVTSFQVGDLEVFLLKPKHFMNNNGKSVLKALSVLDINPSKVLLLHDELDLPIGKFKIKHGGSANGHHGVLDTQERVKYNDFKRMKIGIGRPENKSDVSKFVLQNFTHYETEKLESLMDEMIDLTNKTVLSISNAPEP